MNTVSAAMLSMLLSMQAIAGTHPSPHEQIEHQARAHKIARHVPDKAIKPVSTLTITSQSKSADAAK